MGMSASQARFLGLTARKSNVEYEGQQVNQQRTSLANESAGLFNQMAALNVPIAPNAVDFYSLRYTFTKNGEKCAITKFDAGDDGSYKLTVRKVAAAGTVGTGKVIPAGAVITNTTSTTNPTNAQRTFSMVTTTGTYSLVDSGVDASGKTVGTTGYTPSYSYKGSDGVNYFIAQETLWDLYGNDAPDVNESVTTTSALTPQYNASGTVVYEDIEPVYFSSDETGKFETIYFSEASFNSGTGTDLGIEDVSDDTGYDKAMEDYKYQKMMYDRTISDINARTQIIQQQDKVLEMRLKQLDTEQEALTQEMDAIKKVIDKNVETTFKTFG